MYIYDISVYMCIYIIYTYYIYIYFAYIDCIVKRVLYR